MGKLEPRMHANKNDPVIRVYSRPSRAPTTAEESELPAKSAKNANDKVRLLHFCGTIAFASTLSIFRRIGFQPVNARSTGWKPILHCVRETVQSDVQS